jgi:hypothetical protein
MKSKAVMEFITIWVLVLGSIAFLSHLFNPNPIIRARLERIEPFVNSVSQPPLEPDEVDFSNKSYSLLLDVLPEYKGALPTPTSERCYNSDFTRRVELTGDLRQFTNNYKRGSPDSCSAPNHDLLLSFYKVPPPNV